MNQTELQKSTAAINQPVSVGGAPTKYKTIYEKQAYKVCLLGATDKQLADFFEVTERTINNWKKHFPRFFQSIKKAKLIADAGVAEALFERAKGCSITVQQAIKLTSKTPILNEEGIPTRNTEQTEFVQVVNLKRHYPPDTTAAIFWLKNRNPANWKDKQVYVAGNGLNFGFLNNDPLFNVNDSKYNENVLDVIIVPSSEDDFK